ncbi:PspC domain-containing protein [Candidatus Viridilinea mediisalina]|uniref:Phage shock protein PspC N-terminal domain-containing protein n=1 Tax=Candidatus Viridilinea mediisalina TaxID=2024553 RepID=A0A2A6RKV7_9CHLR|nr:PspC domain-containing protein [Candidatus Viridilinea mediisalina]PDW03535.1 hypothetical protein CJ255_08190 [Candidatus Viridilinea mediisalina]
MQPRLSRSNHERMLGGVCGGIAEYFNIDPVIVRLIFVLITLSYGFGLLAYLLFWFIMPTAPTLHYQGRSDHVDAQQDLFGQQAQQRNQEVFVGQRSAQAGRTGPDQHFDPVSGLPLNPDRPATGRTVNLGTPPDDHMSPYAQSAPQPVRRWKSLGVILVGIGGVILLEQLGINLSLLFPVLLIVAGVVLMRRRPS